MTLTYEDIRPWVLPPQHTGDVYVRPHPILAHMTTAAPSLEENLLNKIHALSEQVSELRELVSSGMDYKLIKGIWRKP